MHLLEEEQNAGGGIESYVKSKKILSHVGALKLKSKECEGFMFDLQILVHTTTKKIAMLPQTCVTSSKFKILNKQSCDYHRLCLLVLSLSCCHN